VQVPDRQGPPADHAPALGPIPDRLRPVLRPGLGTDPGSARLPELHREVGVSQKVAAMVPVSKELLDDSVFFFGAFHRMVNVIAQAALFRERIEPPMSLIERGTAVWDAEVYVEEVGEYSFGGR
jgi:hypothetical protein